MTNPTKIFAVLAAFVLMLFTGCNADIELVKRVKSHVAPMKETYDRGVATYPNPVDQAVRREHWKQLDRVLEVEGAQ